MARTVRKEREVARIRQDILEAAARAFSRKGFRGATMEDIASEAGFAVGSLYHYFKGKDEIYQSVLTAICEEFASVFEEPKVTSLAFPQRLEWLLHRQFEMVERRREFFAMFEAERGVLEFEMTDEAGHFSRKVHAQALERAEEMMAQGIRDGWLRDIGARNLAYFVFGVAHSAVHRWIGGALETSLADHVPVLLDLIFHGMGARKP